MEKYGHVTVINLLSADKSGEATLIAAFEPFCIMKSKENPTDFSYRFFDFHTRCRGQRYDMINELLDNTSDFLNFYMFHAEFEGAPESVQKGVFRTNCLDCLDRTNVVQGYIAWESLVKQLQFIGVNCPTRYEEAESSQIGVLFRIIWTENADVLSIQYTSTGSTISSVTKEGKHGLKGYITHGLRSLGRFYAANMEDSARQKCIEILLNSSIDPSLF